MRHLILIFYIAITFFTTFTFAQDSFENSRRFIGKEDTPEFIAKLNKLADQGDVEAMLVLADWYSLYPRSDYTRTRSLYLKAAKMNNAHAANQLGMMYLNGRGVSKSERNAAICFTQAASSKDFDGLSWLAYSYTNGKGVEQSYTVASALYKIAIPLQHSRNYAAVQNLSTISKAMSVSQLAEARILEKNLLQSNNFFITIEKHLNEHGKMGFYGKPLNAFELTPD